MTADSHETNGIAHAPGAVGRWVLAIRPKTLPAAVSSVVIGTALAANDGGFSPGPALAAFAVALLLQVGSNLANDVYDAERGTDTEQRLGPTRVTHTGLLTPSQVKTGMKVVLGLALVIGLYLTWVRGPLVLVIGVAAIIAAVAYTGGPYPLGYHGLGELFVFVFFGLTAVVGTYWVQTGTTTPLVWLMAVPPGLIITAVLVVNNLRDIEQDRVAGKRTVAVRIGAPATRAEYVACLAGAYLVVSAAVIAGALPPATLAIWLSVPVAWHATHLVLTAEGRPLNVALAATGQTALAFSLLFALGLLLG
ncbi:1,4-dihydroxy-2-naphthoate polyprenyltransferase [Anaerosoma tenue]|uniref:1,4-dihydroxy-2-naphthoate polyprenyltransferase n=1 Tax=Anaerosoma tenue TaxID=2933588 RepID=UPI002260F616|nr:1,4-dihydroxy-2-naphthoate polyprenyltransferase [Anaerosoma tenue]MCK8115441.1 1,4-dihydroxy-2-naphthoate polyprenyltransferase [Anaerosoma tenue]